jgi:hypothetical protein
MLPLIRLRRGVVLLAAASAILAALGTSAAGGFPLPDLPGCGGSAAATYEDPVGDAGTAPDVAEITMTPGQGGTLAVTITLARPTLLRRYGWIILAIDTDRNPATGGMHGSEFFVLTNGVHTVALRRVRGWFSPDFKHRPLDARLTSSVLTYTLTFADLHVCSFDFAVATLDQDADLAPGDGVFTYRDGPCPSGRGGVQCPS